jgi:hypothetical protein
VEFRQKKLENGFHQQDQLLRFFSQQYAQQLRLFVRVGSSFENLTIQISSENWNFLLVLWKDVNLISSLWNVVDFQHFTGSLVGLISFQSSPNISE